MDPKFIVNANATETLTALVAEVKAAHAEFNEKIADLNRQGDVAHQQFQQKHLECWKKITDQMQEQKLISAEEKELGHFMISDHDQILLERISSPRPGLAAVNAAADTADNTGHGGQAEAPEAGL